MADGAPAFTPVTLLTGFLGSGKTTLLRRLLGDPALHDTAVIINEFGEVALDHLLVERLDGETVLLGSGCLCCTVRGDLAATLRDLDSRRERGTIPLFRRLVIETTGLADPFPVLSTLRADPMLRHHFLAAGVVTAVDAVHGLMQLDRYVESMRQAAIADVIALTKTDIAGDDMVVSLQARLAALNPQAPVIRVAEGPLPANALLAAGRSPFRAVGEPDGAAAHTKARAVTIVVDEPLDWSSFGVWLTMLLNRHGTRILRVKGLLALCGEARPIAVHGVQHLVHAPTHLDAWPDGDRRSRLLFIVEDLDPELIRRSFAAFARLGGSQSMRML
ncbi:CobW family GTP-binding protein [Bradyrhizobium sp.]|uniref:CobW family GTP-binding protein n=1 Tax=Bradyrhizobium sp. TaxID=376 RepID=UPI003C60D0A6